MGFLFVLKLFIGLYSSFCLFGETESRFFEEQCEQVTALIQQNDFEQAAFCIKEMQKEAQNKDNQVGMAYACFALGDLCQKKGMLQEALKTYQDAWDQFQGITIPQTTRSVLLRKLLHLSFLEGDNKRMAFFLAEIDKSIPGSLPETAHLHTLYEIHRALQQNDYPAAKAMADGLTANDLSTATEHLLYFTAKSKLYEAGEHPSWALACLTDSLESQFKALDVIDKTYLVKLRATRLLTIGGRHQEGIAEFERLWNHKDSLNREHYQSEINGIRGLNRVNRAALDKTMARNRYLTSLIALISLLIGLLCVLIAVLRKKTRQLIASRERQLMMIEKAKHSIQTKNAFLSNMSHEIRTPLNAIVGFSALLCEDTNLYGEDAIEQSQKIITLNSELLLKLLNDVIDLSHLNLQEINFKIAPCDVVMLGKQVIETVRSSADTQAELVFYSDLSAFSLDTDTNRLQQVMLNLLTNAVKFTPKGTIRLEVRQLENGMAEFSVTDTGCGIPPEKQELLFQRYAKIQDKVAGFGLGLSICYLIIDQLGGKIWYDSTYTQGACFRFIHPVAQEVRVASIG